ncbi:MAG: hypothetical protein HY074_15270 [Deltaproteobacteria bacterium]|nr:hypothetical protein [Deltaproteobacteria bacterium]
MMSSGKVRPILLLEINEVSWRLLDRFKDRFPNIKKFFAGAQTYTTTTVDSGELSPWITWPSFHRGLCDKEHGSGFLGQDPATFKGTPIWAEYRKQGHAIGICGSLQSWPPSEAGPGGFYIPDTFAHDATCIPAYVEPFQRFNLSQVATNGRTVNSSSMFSKEILPLIASLPKLGIRPATLAKVGQQLVEERLDTVKLSRRPAFQTILMWDVFKNLFDANKPPAFSTFFTNHIAGVMHRYWNNLFPEDFGPSMKGQPTPYLNTMVFALNVLDDMLREVMAWCEQNPELVVVWAASMGQDTVHRDSDGLELAVNDSRKLMQICGLEPVQFKPLLAMVPQIAVEFTDAAALAQARSRLQACTTTSGQPLFRIEGSNLNLSITCINPKRVDIEAGFFNCDGGRVTWEDAGVRVVQTTPGTAYHIPEGTMAVYRLGHEPNDARTRMSARDAKSFLLKLGGLSVAAAQTAVPEKVKRKRRARG